MLKLQDLIPKEVVDNARAELEKFKAHTQRVEKDHENILAALGIVGEVMKGIADRLDAIDEKLGMEKKNEQAQ